MDFHVCVFSLPILRYWHCTSYIKHNLTSGPAPLCRGRPRPRNHGNVATAPVGWKVWGLDTAVAQGDKQRHTHTHRSGQKPIRTIAADVMAKP